jgi:hypothetical protein
MDHGNPNRAKDGAGTAEPRHERKPEDRKPGPTRENVGDKEERSDLADIGEAGEQGSKKPGGPVGGEATPLTQGPPNKPGKHEAPDGTTTDTAEPEGQFPHDTGKR